MTIDDAHDTVGTGEVVPPPRRSDEVQPVRTNPPGARPRSEYWDHTTASWRSRGPVVPPRQAD